MLAEPTAADARLPRSFFARPAAVVARALLGTDLCCRHRGGTVLRARIVETEAYTGPEDQASHARNGTRTVRNEPMWMVPGTAYVYFTYGMHHCFNVACLREGHPAAVLIRAARVLDGEAVIRSLRGGGQARLLPAEALLRGPACLCKGLGIGPELSGRDLCDPGGLVWFEPAAGQRRPRIGKSPRVGLGDKNADRALWNAKPLRFFIEDERCVSGPRPWRGG